MKKVSVITLLALILISVTLTSCTVNINIRDNTQDTSENSSVVLPSVGSGISLDGTSKIKLLTDKNVKDIYEGSWTTNVEMFVDNNLEKVKLVIEILNRDGWQEPDAMAVSKYDFTLITDRNQDNVMFSFHFDTGLVSCTSTEIGSSVTVLEKTLTADEINAVKKLAFYYFSAHIE